MTKATLISAGTPPQNPAAAVAEARRLALRSSLPGLPGGPPNIAAEAVTVETTEVGTLVNILGVEIVQTGIEYPLASGPHTFTVDELADAVEAQGDPAIKAPRLRLGHSGLKDPEWDGEPAIGVVGNLRLDQDGHLIRGDYMGVPEWLANVLPSAYPGRSIDGELAVETNTGHHWRLVITGLALLGVRWPGVSTLEDIKGLFSKDGPEGLVVLTTEEEVAELGLAAAGGRIVARVDVSDVERQYYQSLGADQFWWWIRGHYQDPDELIVEDESSGDLFRVPYTVDGSNRTVSFEDPVAVFEEFIDKPKDKQDKAGTAAAVMVLAGRTHKTTAALYGSRNESRRESSVAGEAATTVDLAGLRTAFSLSDDLTDDQVRTALEAAGFVFPPGEEQGGTKAPGAEAPGTTASGAAVPGNDPANVTGPSGSSTGDPAVAAPTVVTQPTAPAGTVAGTRTLDEATFQQLMSDAQAGRTALTRLTNGDRDTAIAAAIQQGRIPKSREEHWKGAWDQDPEGTKTLLTAAADKGGLAPGLIPVAEQGTTPPEGGDGDPGGPAYPAEWLPDIAARNAMLAAQQAAAMGQQPGVAMPLHPNAHLMSRSGW